MKTELSKSAKLKIEYRPIASIKPYAGNARKHPKAQIKRIAVSLRAFGWTNPLIVGDDDDLLCGHGRLEAAKLNGDKTVPVISLAHLSGADRKVYIIADNRLAEEAEWSKSTLRSELSGLAELGYELELTGFDTIEIDTVLAMDGEELDENEVELPDEKAEPVSRVGDLWSIGDHRLFVGGARDPASYETLLGNDRAELIATDPPYGCAIENNVSGNGKVKHENFVMGAGETGLGEFALSLLRPAFKNIADCSKTGAIAFIFIDWRGAPYLYDVAKGVFHEAKNLIVWAKTNGGQGAFYRSAHELIYAFKVSLGKNINNFGLGGRYRTNVWTYAGANTFRPGRMKDLHDHPTVKPKKMIADAILDCSTRGGIVLDPFLGSGTTICAAQQTGRKGYGMELDPKYADVCLKRIVAACELPAMLDGTPFDEVAAKRLSRGRRISDKKGKGKKKFKDGNTLPDGTYKIGKNKPPVDTPFAKNDGKPRGRRKKGTSNLKTDFQAEMCSTVSLTVNGQKKRVTKQRAIIMRLMDNASRGQQAAIRQVLEYGERFGAEMEAAEKHEAKPLPGIKGMSIEEMRVFSPLLRKAMGLEPEPEPEPEPGPLDYMSDPSDRRNYHTWGQIDGVTIEVCSIDDVPDKIIKIDNRAYCTAMRADRPACFDSYSSGEAL